MCLFRRPSSSPRIYAREVKPSDLLGNGVMMSGTRDTTNGHLMCSWRMAIISLAAVEASRDWAWLQSRCSPGTILKPEKTMPSRQGFAESRSGNIEGTWGLWSVDGGERARADASGRWPCREGGRGHNNVSTIANRRTST